VNPVFSPLVSEEETSRAREFRRFARENVEPHSARMDREEVLVPEVLEALRATRFLCPNAPTSSGGLGLDHLSLGLLLYELGRVSTATAALVAVQTMVMRSLLRWGDPDQIATFVPDLAQGRRISAFALSEPAVGSQASAVTTRVKLAGDRYVMSGHKKWITAGQIADWLLVFANDEAGPAAWMVHAEDHGVSRRPIGGMLGQRGAMLAEIVLQDCELPVDRRIGKEGAGIRYVAAHALELGRYGVGWMGTGLAQACLDAALEYAAQRSQFDKKLDEHQLIRRKISNMSTDVTAAKLMCVHVGRLLDAHDPRSVTEAAMAKYFTSRVAGRAASEAVQVHGAVGCSAESHVERLFRDARILEIIEGTTEIQQILLSKHRSSIPF